MAREWKRALITGASSGIGEEFARRLAKRGTNLVIVARRTERLAALANELEAAHRIDVETITADLTDRDALAHVEERVAASTDPVDLLVNNAGVVSRGRLHELDPDRTSNEILIDVVAVVRLMQRALPGMVQRRHGGVINVSSVAAFYPSATLAVYSGAKACITAITEAVSEELRGTGVVVSALCPGVTPTEFGEVAELDLKRTGLPTTPVGKVVDDALRGVDRGQVIVVPGIVNDLNSRVARIMPRAVVRRAAAFSTLRTSGRAGT